MKLFKDKNLYLIKRHELLKKELEEKREQFEAQAKTINKKEIKPDLLTD